MQLLFSLDADSRFTKVCIDETLVQQKIDEGQILKEKLYPVHKIDLPSMHWNSKFWGQKDVVALVLPLSTIGSQ